VLTSKQENAQFNSQVFQQGTKMSITLNKCSKCKTPTNITELLLMTKLLINLN